MEVLSGWITHYGYAGLCSLLMLGIIGLPVPDETLLTFSGYLISIHKLSLPLTLLSAISGSLAGITISYFLGRSLGIFLLQRYGKYVFVTPEKLELVHGWFQRRGKWTLIIGYYIPGVRHLTAYTAGASKLELPTFCAFAFSGGILWSSTFIFLGLTLGSHWHRVVERLQHNILLGSVALVILVGVAWLIRKKLKIQK